MLGVLLVDAPQAAESLLGAFRFQADKEDREGGMGWTRMCHYKRFKIGWKC